MALTRTEINRNWRHNNPEKAQAAAKRANARRKERLQKQREIEALNEALENEDGLSVDS